MMCPSSSATWPRAFWESGKNFQCSKSRKRKLHAMEIGVRAAAGLELLFDSPVDLCENVVQLLRRVQTIRLRFALELDSRLYIRRQQAIILRRNCALPLRTPSTAART